MLMPVIIAVILVLVGVLLLWLGQRAWRSLMDGASHMGEVPERTAVARPETSQPLRADALVYLFAHRFVRPPKPGKAITPRLQAFAPMTEEELDPCDWAAKLLFVLLAEQYQAGTLEFRVVERTPTLMPPYPHKNWELQVRRLGPPLSSPLGDCMAVAFDMVEKRARSRAGAAEEGAPGEEEALVPEEEAQWFPLELVVEKMLQVVRTETTFWQREGVYGDLRNYVADALVAEGYLVEKTAHTWIEHFRRRRLEPDRGAIARWEEEAESLLRQVAMFRQTQGSAEFRAEEERDVSYTHLNTPATLTRVDDDVRQIMWADALGITIYETLVSLRQLEPTGDGSV